MKIRKLKYKDGKFFYFLEINILQLFYYFLKTRAENGIIFINKLF